MCPNGFELTLPILKKIFEELKNSPLSLKCHITMVFEKLTNRYNNDQGNSYNNAL